MKALTLLKAKDKAPNNKLAVKLQGHQAPSILALVESYEEASALQSAYVAEFDLGGSTFLAGDVYGEDAKINISYNGRVWRNGEEINLVSDTVNTLIPVYIAYFQDNY